MNIAPDLQRFNQFFHEMTGLYHEVSLKMSLADSVVGILYTLRAQERDCCLSEIARLNGMSRQTLNSAIRKLEAQGLVALAEGGGRRRCAYLTEAGLRLAEARIDPIIQMEGDLLEDWSPQDRRELFRLLDKYCADYARRLKNLAPIAEAQS